MPSTALWWIKKDFRLTDNPALTAALDASSTVVPVFLFEPAVLRAQETSGFHVAAWVEALEDLRARLKSHGADVLVLHGDAVESLGRLRDELTFEAIWSHEEIGSSVTFERDKAVASWCEASGVAWHEERQTGVFRGALDRDTRSKRWKAFTTEGPLPAPDVGSLQRVRVPEAALALQPPGGRAAGGRSVRAYADGCPARASPARQRDGRARDARRLPGRARLLLLRRHLVPERRVRVRLADLGPPRLGHDHRPRRLHRDRRAPGGAERRPAPGRGAVAQVA